jgi:hypothetical protein
VAVDPVACTRPSSDDIVKRTSAHFGITRQAANRCMHQLEAESRIKGRATVLGAGTSSAASRTSAPQTRSWRRPQRSSPSITIWIRPRRKRLWLSGAGARKKGLNKYLPRDYIGPP